METVSLDGSYSDEIRAEIWTAIDNMEDFSNPWVVVSIRAEKIKAKIFNNKEAAQEYINKAKKKSNTSEQYFCIKATYQTNL
jgi:hypothetical protein